MADIDRPHYSHSFVADYLLIKVNNLLSFGGEDFKTFAWNLGLFYNEYIKHPEKYPFRFSYNEAELMAQVMLHSHSYQFLTPEQAEIILKSGGMVVASMA